MTDAELIHALRTRRRRDGWAQLMIAAADRLEELTTVTFYEIEMTATTNELTPTPEGHHYST